MGGIGCDGVWGSGGDQGVKGGGEEGRRGGGGGRGGGRTRKDTENDVAVQALLYPGKERRRNKPL